MEYPNSPPLQKWLEDSGLGVIATQDSFVIDDVQFAEQRQLLESNKVREDHLDDRAAFRCLTLRTSAGGPQAPLSKDSVDAQNRQLAERARQQKAHEIALIAEIDGFKKTQADTQEFMHALGDQCEALGDEAAHQRVFIQTIVDEQRKQIESKLSESVDMLAVRLDAVEARLSNVSVATAQLCDYETEARLSLEVIAKGQNEFNSWAVNHIARVEHIQSLKKWAVIALIVLLTILLGAKAGFSQNVNGDIVVAACGTPPSPFPAAGQRGPGTVDTNGYLCASVTGSSISVTFPSSLIVTTSLGGGSGTVVVTGSASDNTTATFSPVQIGGVDSTGKIQAIKTGSDGAVVVDASGTAIPISGTVTVGNGAGGSAVNIQDGGNSITVDGSVTVTQATGTNLHAVLDSGTTTVTQATGTNLHAVLDTTSTTAVTQATASSLNAQVVGSVASGSVPGNPVATCALSSTVCNTLQMASLGSGLKTDLTTINNGVTILTGTGATGTGAQRVTVAVDSATVAGSATLPAGTNTIGAVTGTLTNNGAAPAATTNVGALNCLVNAAVPTFTEGRLTLESCTISGFQRVTLPIITLAPYMSSSLGAAVNAFATSGDILDSVGCTNSSTTANAFLQIFNTTAASVTLGTTTPAEQYMVPFGGGIVLTNMHTAYSAGIAVASTTTATGSTAQAIVCTIKAYVP